MAIDSVFSDSSRVFRRYLGGYQLVCGGACFVALFGPDVPHHRVLPSVFCTSCLREQSFFSTIGGSTGVYRGSARSNLVGQPPSTAPSSLRYRTRSAFPSDRYILVQSCALVFDPRCIPDPLETGERPQKMSRVGRFREVRLGAAYGARCALFFYRGLGASLISRS